ncbi:TIGR03790 family protein [Pontiellaceae bacterium B12227]|nr:TIGR03790 family protein [Pontiellaceae bacterium B12227]
MLHSLFGMIRVRGLICLSAVMLMSLLVQAQMPQEILLLVNRQSQASLKVANTYIAVRQIPRRNVVYLDVPESAYGGSATVSPEEFTKLIWEPANAAVNARGLDQQVLAWVYSVDFPIRVKTDSNDRKQMSVGGMTFMRNKMPGLSLVEDGKYFSKLFAGPNERLKMNLNTMSLGMQKKGLGEAAKVPPEAAWLQYGLRDRMPLPSMMLGYVGEKGNDVETVLKSIGRGAKSDFRGQRSGIYFVQSDDVRSKCREYQFYPAINELKSKNISAMVTTNFPAGKSNVMGVLMGAENVDPSQITSFAPGAMAEHLTSWSAEFQKRQSKCTDWIEAGATATAGAVVEPYSNPNKFPSARFFVHYAAGSTMLESFYQSIACPLQSLLLGDPLAKPYALPFSVKILGADSLKSDFTFLAMAEARVQNAQFQYAFYLDGKEIKPFSDDNSVHVRLYKLSDGYHELRAVASIRHMVEFNMSAVKPITVVKRGRSVTILPQISRLGKHEHGIKVEIGGSEKPEKIRLVSGELVIDEKVYDPEAELVLDELMVGEGPNQVQAVGIFADGMEVASAPISFGIAFAKD